MGSCESCRANEGNELTVGDPETAKNDEVPQLGGKGKKTKGSKKTKQSKTTAKDDLAPVLLNAGPSSPIKKTASQDLSGVPIPVSIASEGGALGAPAPAADAEEVQVVCESKPKFNFLPSVGTWMISRRAPQLPSNVDIGIPAADDAKDIETVVTTEDPSVVEQECVRERSSSELEMESVASEQFGIEVLDFEPAAQPDEAVVDIVMETIRKSLEETPLHAAAPELVPEEITSLLDAPALVLATTDDIAKVAPRWTMLPSVGTWLVRPAQCAA